jgi:hypothetical protein
MTLTILLPWRLGFSDGGYEATRAGLRLGPKARERMPARLGAAVDDPRQLAAAIASYAAAWEFGR